MLKKIKKLLKILNSNGDTYKFVYYEFGTSFIIQCRDHKNPEDKTVITFDNLKKDFTQKSLTYILDTVNNKTVDNKKELDIK